MPDLFDKFTLDNGVRIISERIPYVRSASAGIWIASGSRHETAAECGAAHFIEHMLFKGTINRSASEIAADIDAIGGQTNAFTSKEHTCFYGRSLDAHLHVLLDVLCDMFFNPLFNDNDVISERGVILEEIDMYEDTPEELVSERLFSAVYKGNSLARPILGTPTRLAAMSSDFLRNYMLDHYLAGNVVVALAGNFSDDDIRFLTDRFALLRPGFAKVPKPALYKSALTVKKKRIEQNHLCLAFPACSFSDDRRYAFQLLCSILGGGMSSRLFQSLRENLGLCYSIFSFISSHDDTGLFSIAAALNKDSEASAIAAIIDELIKIRDSGVAPDELNRAREQLKANIMLGLESTGSRMHRLAKNELCLGFIPSPQDLIDAYNAVSPDDILNLARLIFHQNLLSFSAVGKVAHPDEYRTLLSSLPF